MQVEPEHEPLPRAVGSQDFPVEAFNPLLRSLLGWGLVERVELDDATHRWELTKSAQQRLDELTPKRRRAAETLAYLDHWCSSCAQQRLTHLVDGRYLCQACEQGEASGSQPQPASRRLGPEPRPSLLRRDR